MPLQARAKQLCDDLSLIWEKRAAQLYDMANQIAPGGLSPAVFSDQGLRDRYLRLAHSPLHTPSGTPDCNREGLMKHLSSDRETDCALLCRILSRMAGLDASDLPALITALLPAPEAENAPEADDESEDAYAIDYRPGYESEEDFRPLPLPSLRLTEEDEADLNDDGNRVIYLRSSYTDDAYLRFSEMVPELRADYASSFSAVCEAVYYNPSFLCILPLENTTDGSLTSFRNLIARHGLKIICTCDVPSGEEQLTRFALLKRSLSPIPGQNMETETKFLRFVLYSGAEVTLSETLHAAQICDLSLYKTDTVPTSYGTDSFAFDVTLKIDARSDLAAFLIWLLLEAPESEIVGIYPHREADE